MDIGKVFIPICSHSGNHRNRLMKGSVSPLIAKTFPLCILPAGGLVCYCHGRILVLHEKEEGKSFSLPISNKENLLGWNKKLARLLRFGVRSAVAIDNNNVCLSIGDYIYETNLQTGSTTNGFCCGAGIRPLAFSNVKSVNGFEDGIYFGGYIHNFDKEPVSIYKRKGTDKWEAVFTFPKGAINHVHNVIPDPYRNCLWIFTGDFGDSAAIWKATNGFKGVERVVYGDQKWRGCVVFALPEGLLYATDTPFSKNYIYLLKEDGSVDTVGKLSGSCIYGCQWKDKYVFSSTVEPDGRNESLMKLLFSKERGAGIEDDYVRIYIGNLETGFAEIYKEKKDRLPYLFQFGAFKFPEGVNNTDTLFFQPVATNTNDLNLMAYIE